MNLGADIAMAFDECPPHPAPREAVAEATARTTRWAKRSSDAHTPRRPVASSGSCRAASTSTCASGARARSSRIGFPGHAIGGLSVGEPKADMHARARAPRSRCCPRTSPATSWAWARRRTSSRAWRAGVDMFDCVLPTRNARNGQLFTRSGRLSIRNAQLPRRSPAARPGLSAATRAGRLVAAYLRHLHLAGEMSAATLDDDPQPGLLP